MSDTRLRGIDVSRWQGAIDWPTVATVPGLAFVYVRASHGVRADERAAENLSGARLAGLRVGGYHYLEQHSDPVAQALAFRDALGGDIESLPARLLPMLDVEEGGRDTGARALAFLTAFQAIAGSRCGVYTMPSFAAASGLDRLDELAASPLWLAHWTSAPAPILPRPWPAWALWQYTNRLRVPGIAGPVDGSVAAGLLPEATPNPAAQEAP